MHIFNDASVEETSRDFAYVRWEKNKEHVQRTLAILRRHLTAESRILDLCCGPGTFLVPLAREGRKVEGVDKSTSMISLAQEYATRERVNIIISWGDATALQKGAGTYDVVLLLGSTLGTIFPRESRESVLHECNRVLKRGGTLFFVETVRENTLRWRIFLLRNLILWLLSGMPAVYGDITYYFSGKKVIYHYFSRGELEDILRRSGFTVTERDNLRIGGAKMLFAVCRKV